MSEKIKGAIMSVKISQNPENEIPVEILADSIEQIAIGIKRLNGTRLSNDAIAVLVSHASKEPITTVRKVLRSLNDLEKLYMKPRTSK